MKKDASRDYATNAFRVYAVLGEKGRKKIRSAAEITSIVQDVEAVDKTLESIGKLPDGDIITKAVKSVYFCNGKYAFSRGEIVRRVCAVKEEIYVSEIQIYRYLRLARETFCKIRGLCTWGDLEACGIKEKII